MKKVLIRAYSQKNLGDDLFIKILLDRYPETKFYMYSTLNYKNSTLKKYKNVKIVNHYMVRIINKLNSIFKINKYSIENIMKNKVDIMLNLGGSMFIENSSITQTEKNIKNIYNTIEKKYYIIGSNFGPYKNEKYKECYEEVFKNAEDVCFREKYSYDMFKDIDTVKYGADIVFSLDISNIKTTNSKRIVISVINCEKRFEIKIKEAYENKIVELSNYFVKQGYEVVLMSFCSKEGDLKAIKSILSKCDKENINNILTYNYSGNIEEALNTLGNSSIIIATRFHAAILGILLNKKTIPIIYSNKTMNVLKDIEFTDEYIDINNIEKLDIDSLNVEQNCKVDLKKQFERAQIHFKKLDKELLGEK